MSYFQHKRMTEELHSLRKMFRRRIQELEELEARPQALSRKERFYRYSILLAYSGEAGFAIETLEEAREQHARMETSLNAQYELGTFSYQRLEPLLAQICWQALERMFAGFQQGRAPRDDQLVNNDVRAEAARVADQLYLWE